MLGRAAKGHKLRKRIIALTTEVADLQRHLKAKRKVTRSESEAVAELERWLSARADHKPHQPGGVRLAALNERRRGSPRNGSILGN